MRSTAIAFALLVAVAGCDASTDTANGADLGAASDGGDAVPNLRGGRYCEVLVATINSPNVHVDVFNTQGLNDCPADAWLQLDADQLKTQLGASMVLLNGPRYWMLDAFVQASLIDPTPKTFGTIAMRQAGSIDLTLAEVMMVNSAYIPHQIQRNTVVRFDAGKPLFELVDPKGRVYDLQSYSVQKTPQTEADLATLGSRLTVPQGWTFRSRVPSSDLLVTAVDQVATVVQDDFANTYQLSQQ